MPEPKLLAVLFKSFDDESESDPYEAELSKKGIETAFIPVIEHNSVNDDDLVRIFVEGPQDTFGGIIFTSSRAAEMWVKAADKSQLSNTVGGCVGHPKRSSFDKQ